MYPDSDNYFKLYAIYVLSFVQSLIIVPLFLVWTIVCSLYRRSIVRLSIVLLMVYPLFTFLYKRTLVPKVEQ